MSPMNNQSYNTFAGKPLCFICIEIGIFSKKQQLCCQYYCLNYCNILSESDKLSAILNYFFTWLIKV